ncbi:MAG: type II secretion system protein [Microthrixaceae bacterium]
MARQESPNHHSRRHDQRGSTLLIVLVIMVIMSIVIAAVMSFANASNKGVTAYRELRGARYAGGGAIDAAVNWAKLQPNVARDPNLDVNDPVCSRVVSTDIGDLKVSCGDEPEDSGKPKDPGINPPEDLLLTGIRQNEPGPYNTDSCKGWWDIVWGWMKRGVVNSSDTAPAEFGAWFKGRPKIPDFLDFSNGVPLWTGCNGTRQRSRTAFQVVGNMTAAGVIQVDDGRIVSSANGRIAATQCIRLACITPIPNRADGTPGGSDPARTNPASPWMNAFDIKDEWSTLPFDPSSGALRSGYSLPERTTAYALDASAPGSSTVPAGLSAISGCPGASTTVVMLPGWYRSNDLLTYYTSSCQNRNVWLAPNPGPDNRLLTEDDIPGAYYLDFRGGTAHNCGADQANIKASTSLWCIGGAAKDGVVSGSNSRVTAGTPAGWAPLSPTSTTDPNRNHVSLFFAATIDNDLSVTWYNAGGAIFLGDGNYAHYKPCSVFGWFNCTSTDRAIRMRNYYPKTTGSPIDDPGYPNGRIFIKVSYSQTGGGTNAPRLQVRAVSSESGSKDCGTYQLPAHTGTATPQPYTFTDAQAKQVADRCGTPDLINGLELKFVTTGNFWNSGTPELYLDGATISYDTFQGPSFPTPVSGTNLAAKTDCDPHKPGVQLIFGGESHVYVADGSLEVCGATFDFGSPTPPAAPTGLQSLTSPENHLVFGAYSMPAVPPITMSSVVSDGGVNMSVTNPDGAKRIDDAAKNSANYATLNYGGTSCAVWPWDDPCPSESWGQVKLVSNTYEPPPGYKISKIAARVSYNPKNTFCTYFIGCIGFLAAKPQITTPLNCTIDLVNNADQGNIQIANSTNDPNLLLYDETRGSGNCIRPGDIAGSGAPFRFRAKAKCFWIYVASICGNNHDTLDGIELDVTLLPSDNTQPRLIPASGCVVAQPNYRAGEGRPDCALIRADMTTDSDTAYMSNPFDLPREGTWTGRVSVQGTIYAPSAPMELDDTDAAYTVATRGAILRTLRISGWAQRFGTALPAFGGKLDKTPIPREATFTACRQSAARLADNTKAGKCDASQDQILTTARYRFNLDTVSSIPDGDRSRVPNLLWWIADA